MPHLLMVVSQHAGIFYELYPKVEIELELAGCYDELQVSMSNASSLS